MSDEAREFSRIQQKHYMREKRKLRSGKDHLLDNLKAKRGMQLLKKEGNLRMFTRRNGGKTLETRDWELYHRACKNNADYLASRKPDVVEIINEKIRNEKEKERLRKKKVEEDGGEWLYNGECGEYYWSGESEPKDLDDNFEYEQLTREELENIRKQERLQDEAIAKFRKAEINESKRKKAQERKDLLSEPLDPLPEKDPSEYEKLREKNIRDRVDAMEKSGFFKDLSDYKKAMGLTNQEKTVITRKGNRKRKEKQKDDKEDDTDSAAFGDLKDLTIKGQGGNSSLLKESRDKNISTPETVAEYYLHDCLE